MIKPRICLIEDDAIMGEALVERLDMEGYDCDRFQRGREALSGLLHKGYRLVISDIRLPDISGEDLFAELRQSGQALPPFLFITGHGAIDQAVRLLKLGAEDYMTKPLNVPLLLDKVRLLSSHATPATVGTPQLGISSAMRRIEAVLPRIASHARTVLITGESGVGKEVVARALHAQADPTGRQPFVAVNCGAVSESLMEAELFGHEKGAFTGAIKEHKGCFEQADGGTLFLDEIGDMSLGMQVKLLRAIQERAIVRVGGQRTIPIDIRLVCATHRDLRAMVEGGRFREDLYYRIHVVQIDIPPLRERKEDILWLASRLIENFRKDGLSPRLHPSAEQALLERPWHGNVRELGHCIERAAILGDAEVITADMLRGKFVEADAEAPPTTPTLGSYLAESERRYIQQALARHDGRIADTAAGLGISRKNLWEKMRKLGIDSALDGSA
ncbi:MAG: sigma-54 dependent transcriptional regulator [Sulfuritalea sp.]|nr:sigma-54 dependent transcriptional regulator [Sulfuritalea sp.]